MCGLPMRWIMILPLVLLPAGCETKPPEPYFLVTPDSVFPSESSALSRWDSHAELRQWVENPWTQAPYVLGVETGVEFARADLRAGVNSSLYGPNLQPPFTGLRAVRVRVRYFPTAAGPPTGLVVAVTARVTPTGPADPTNPRTSYYYARVTEGPGEWQIVEAPPDPGRGYPPVVDARWLYVAIGRNAEIVADVDWIELVRD